MLVLSRKVGERILIGDDIAVTIVRVTGGGVRVGIEAPTNMQVLRAEIKAEATALKENASAAAGSQAAMPPEQSVTTIGSVEPDTTVAPPIRKPR